MSYRVFGVEKSIGGVNFDLGVQSKGVRGLGVGN